MDTALLTMWDTAAGVAYQMNKSACEECQEGMRAYAKFTYLLIIRYKEQDLPKNNLPI